MASGGWMYRNAYFMDFDGKYYKVTVPTAKGNGGIVIYNIGQMKEEALPKIKGSYAGNGNDPRGNASIGSIRSSGGNSQEKSGESALYVESIIKCRRNRYGFSCIIFLSEGRRKEVKTLNGYSYLTLEQRREIERMYAEGERVVDIAARLKRSAAAIYEELKRGYTGEFDGYARPKYSADLAQATVQENFRRRGNRRGANC